MNIAKRIAALSALSLVVVACGGDDSGGDGAQAELADRLIADAESEELDVDEGCVREQIGELSDDDAQLLLDNFDADDVPDGLSTEGEATVVGIFECVEFPDLDLDELSDPDDADG